jgi:beta-galactosidase
MLRSFLIFSLAAATLAAAEPPAGRVRFTINDEWRCAAGDVTGAERPGHDDGSWKPLDVPHTWNAHDAFDDTPGYRRGVGWYRKQLHLDPALRSKRLFLYFEGVNQVADVWVNGRPAGRHVGGYTAFVVDVTELVKFDGENVVAVRVDNAHDPDIPPWNGDFTFYGGIYRDVWLVATDPVHVTVTDHASPGVFIQTPRVDAESATVRVFGTVTNASGAAVRMRVVNRVIDPEGVSVAERATPLTIAAGVSRPFDVLLPPVARPALWSPATPNLYRVATEVYRGEDLVGRIENPLGFRWFSVDSQKGFFLNGKKLKLAGTNRHQDRAGYGNALSDPLHRRDVEIVRVRAERRKGHCLGHSHPSLTPRYSSSNVPSRPSRELGPIQTRNAPGSAIHLVPSQNFSASRPMVNDTRLFSPARSDTRWNPFSSFTGRATLATGSAM